jgi:hypothetical protein
VPKETSHNSIIYFFIHSRLPSKSSDRSSLQKVMATVYGKWHPKKFGLYFFGVARKRDLVFIAIGELHVGLAWDIS